MNRRLFVPLVIAGLAAASGVASANPSYWRDNGLLLEVSADPRDGRDFVQVDATRANQLELIALTDVVTLRGMTIHFADGRAMSQHMGFVRPGQPVMVTLPHNCAPITSVELDYGDPALRRYDRTPARLQIVPRMTRPWQQPRPHYSSYSEPSGYYVERPRDRVVRPRPVRSSWQIQGSFRF